MAARMKRMATPMKSRLRALLLACTALVSVTTAATAQQTVLRGPGEGQVRALVVGIDAYRHVRPLKGAVPDARDIETSLRRTGVADVTSLIDDAADRDSILRAINALLSRTMSGDLVLLSIAGHGAQEPEHVKGSQPDGMDSVFLLPGFDTTAAGSKQRIIGTEFNHFIKKFEERGARVLFVADTCHGGGMTRDADPRAEEMSFRQVPLYRIPEDAYVPISTTAEAFLTEFDFEKTAFLAAVDRKTKAPEVRIPGIASYRGALSYAFARAIEGSADSNRDGKVTLKELFTYVRQVVYQLSDQRQNPVTLNSPHRNIENELAFEMTRAVKIVDASPEPAKPAGSVTLAAAPVSAIAPVRIASLDGQAARLSGLSPREAVFDVVPPSQAPDLVWDPGTGDVLVGADVIAYRLDKAELPSAIDRAAAVRALKQLAAKAPQSMRVIPGDAVHRKDSQVAVEIGNLAGRALVMFNIAGDGTVQMLYPMDADPRIIKDDLYRLPVRVRAPYGSDLVIAITSEQPMPMLEQALLPLNQRRSALAALKAVERYRPLDGRIGSTGIFTAP
jgi:uncharacterized caspase-like protein